MKGLIIWLTALTSEGVPGHVVGNTDEIITKSKSCCLAVETNAFK